MTYFLTVIFILYAAGVASLAWNLWRTWLLVGEQRAQLGILDSGKRDLPTLDVLIPVKDEAANIRACIESVLSQNYPNLRIIVVNDRSTDGTVEAIAAVQANHPGIIRVDITELPSGMYGKPHAVHSAAPHLASEIIAFVDSDLLLDPNCLGTLVCHLQENKLDWVATMGKPQITRFWERLLVPLLGAVTFAWYDPRKISNPEWKDAIGSALMVTRRSAYDAIGGHGAVIRTYDEDSELIRIAKRAGQRVSFVLTPELFKQRHYGSYANTIRGLTRTFIGGIKTIPRLLLTIHALNFVSLFPFFVAIIALITQAMGLSVPLGWYWLALAGGHWVISTTMAQIIYKTAGTPIAYAFIHPLGSAIMIGVCIKAAIRVRRGTAITWRGTTTEHAPGGHAA